MNQSGHRYFRFAGILLREGWLIPAYVAVDASGTVVSISKTNPTDVAVEDVPGFALPGFQNAHSHAFQYAMTGNAEVHPKGIDDDFWTWREEMYKCALSMNPQQAEAVAAMLYAEMLRNGYTHVAEFHYLHHDTDGRPYSNLAEMGERMLAAAHTAGIRITLVPVFYQKGGFGVAPTPRQRRFISQDVDAYLKLLDESAQVTRSYDRAQLAFSVHSLRAVDAKEVQKTLQQGPKDLPFHIHVSEQKKEVTDCAAFSGSRPMQWLLDNANVDGRFHLVHSTHLDDQELRALASTQANVVLCPSTEGNLGDGIFRMKEYVSLGGHWSIGTDSHIGLDPLEEFRMIDYRQRLTTNFRNTFSGDGAAYMVNESIERGRMAMGLVSKNHFEVGRPFDAVVYQARSPRLSTASVENLTAAIVYHANSSMTLGTIVDGKWVVKNQRHIAFEKIRTSFVEAMKELYNS